jgi:hypothetical protein
MSTEWDQLENALAWFAPAPSRWLGSVKQDLSAAAEWIWVVVQGDFAEDQTTAQTITGTVVSMIPLVDQMCDVRDIVANCRKLHEDSSNKGHWMALVLTLLGLFPILGSLLKGTFKILFSYGRKFAFKAGDAALDSGFWKASEPYVERGMQKLNEFLGRPEVRKYIAAKHWDHIYMELAKHMKNLAAQVNTSALLKIMDEQIANLKKLTDLIEKWGSVAMKTQVGELLLKIKGVRDKANANIASVLGPVQDWLNRLAQRLEVEHHQTYKVTTNAINIHNFKPPSNAAEIQAFKERPPKWVEVTDRPTHKPLKNPPEVPMTHFRIDDKAKDPHVNAFKAFHDTAVPEHLPPGTVIYRVVAPNSWDNSVYWMSEQEFKKLRSKDDWRRQFAVFASWNANGEFVTYTVPHGGAGLAVWRGKTASQALKDADNVLVKADDKGNFFWLKGGAEQLAIDPKDLEKAHLGKRQFTGWGYDDLGKKVDLVGVPTITNNWRE